MEDIKDQDSSTNHNGTGLNISQQNNASNHRGKGRLRKQNSEDEEQIQQIQDADICNLNQDGINPELVINVKKGQMRINQAIMFKLIFGCVFMYIGCQDESLSLGIFSLYIFCLVFYGIIAQEKFNQTFAYQTQGINFDNINPMTTVYQSQSMKKLQKRLAVAQGVLYILLALFGIQGGIKNLANEQGAHSLKPTFFVTVVYIFMGIYIQNEQKDLAYQLNLNYTLKNYAGMIRWSVLIAFILSLLSLFGAITSDRNKWETDSINTFIICIIIITKGVIICIRNMFKDGE